jgi:hypothetical protein
MSENGYPIEGEYQTHVCDVCGEEKECRYIADPYQGDVDGVVVMRWLCDSCYGGLCGDI